MLQAIIITTALVFSQPMILFDFNEEANLRYWQVVDDVVMGGRSDGRFGLTAEGHGHFTGKVSLENNGGFSSLRYATGTVDVSGKQALVLRLKGDGKEYQVRLKRNRYEYHSYIKTITTSGEWQTITVPLNEMYPSFRGYRVDLPDFEAKTIEEFAILIGNKKAEEFELLIDAIHFE